MPALFDQHGICFEFPENWDVDASSPSVGELSVTVSSPATAFWSLSGHRGDVSPEELLDQALAAMRQEYPALECDEASEEIEDQPMVGYDLAFFFVDLCSVAKVRSFRRGGFSYLLMCQAEDREMTQVEPVFRAMTASLLRHVPAQHY